HLYTATRRSAPRPPLYDVVIIGAGPAGSAAAIALSESGHSVVLLERHHYPRHKMCGEFLSPETVPIFEQLGVWEEVQAVHPARITAARITEPGGQRLDVALPAPALGLSRYRLDHLLVERARVAGAEVSEGCVVSEVHGSLDQGFEVVTHEGSVRARVVLGAWGKRSTLDRSLARPFFGRRAGFMALKAHFQGPEPEERTELHAFPGGYCGINRVEGEAVNVCLLATDGAWERSGKSIPAFWQMIQEENAALAMQLRYADKVTEDIVISNISFARKSPVERDILMLGDSAELISPLAGNGQAIALHAALLAAPLVDDFLAGRQSAAQLCQGYARTWHRHFSKRLTLGRLLQPLFLHPLALSAGLRLTNTIPRLATWLVEETRERRGVRGAGSGERGAERL
ncbi:MAG: FAD-dependent oxidoreductase, partial [Chloroflexota bacterium]|nr:FAD-dependent oxidoreductase [Chloroflexota bacterium]